MKVALRGVEYIVAHPSEFMSSGPTGRYMWVFAVYSLILPAFSEKSYYPNGWFFPFCIHNSGEKWVENPAAPLRRRGKMPRKNAEKPKKTPDQGPKRTGAMPRAKILEAPD
ncbi:MAG: hypothetical protein LBC26_04430 [Oscillospiraceae bacterium]|jgi:hypothetical protein|nr:hypothetical protein [Oscillospiraceae bacterium]